MLRDPAARNEHKPVHRPVTGGVRGLPGGDGTDRDALALLPAPACGEFKPRKVRFSTSPTAG